MQRFRYQAKKYGLLSFIFLILFLFFWFYFCYDILNTTDSLIDFTDEIIIINLFSKNYQGVLSFTTIYPIMFSFALNYLLSNDKAIIIVRLKSRGAYLKGAIFNILLFSFIFAFLHEAVNTVMLFCFFDSDLIFQMQIPVYICINLLTVFLYYIRVGILFLLLRICTNRIFAPLLVFLIYYVEFHIQNLLAALPISIPTPMRDATIISALLDGSTQIQSVIPLIIRSISLTLIVFVVTYFIFQKKDVLSHEKQ